VLYLSAEGAKQCRAQCRELLTTGGAATALIELEMLREVAKEGLALAWRAQGAEAIVSQSAAFADGIVGVCRDGVDTAAMLVSLMKHDGDTFSHVSNVCTYAIMLALGLGISEDRQLAALGQAALLHDLGKRRIHGDILRKPGRLSAQERWIIEAHPRLGFEELCELLNLDRDQLSMVYHHHEKLDGTGYPVGLAGDEIEWPARLCAVVDVFDALTGRRAYRAPATAEQAVSYLEQNVGRHFDPEMVACWSNLVRSATSPFVAT
jgi:HD-GYP domain-containing protein (c-di-GMP phosphodiesterase class II)